MDWPAIVGANIRRLRDAQDRSIEDLAFAADLDSGYLGNIERGRRNPSLKKIIGIATALGVDPKALFNRSSK
jgi:transcriptional regulator with XRE-family HTH domain